MNTVPSTAPPVPANPFRHHAADDHVVIRGRRLPIGELVDPKLFDLDYIEGLRTQVAQSTPFRHLVADGWFNPELLELAREEFSVLQQGQWTEWASHYQKIYRSPAKLAFGPATTLYFNLVNAGWFVDLLSYVMDVPHLIADPQLFGGGLHESRTGGRFSVHRDFDRHPQTGLQNEMSMMTYLNRDWDPAWGGALELWDGEKKRAQRFIQPEFNRIAVVSHGPVSFHGHPEPMQLPEGVTRRSLSSYYYSNRSEPGLKADKPPQSTQFLIWKKSERLREAARSVAPPILWNALKRALER